ncbi:MAG: DoxX family protein [Bacteroidia bacterium]|nr:DoxX family protein [Bacteroidia bacterium]
MHSNLLLRAIVAIILLTHSIPGMFDGGVNAFGSLYLNEIGFAPLGVPIAWAIKLSHVACAVALVANRYVVAACIVTIFVLVMGIIMVHLPEGWYVVGGGRNGIEYNVLLIVVLLHVMFAHVRKKTGTI